MRVRLMTNRLPASPPWYSSVELDPVTQVGRPVLRRIRRGAGDGEARSAGISGDPIGRQEISRYETGKRTPREWLPFIAAALVVSVEDLTAPLAKLTDDNRERVAYSIAHPSRIDAATVRALADVLAAQRRLDDSLGSAAVLTPTLAQLSTVEALAKESTGSDVGLALRGVVAEWVRFTGWLHASMRKYGDAVRLFARAEELADQANDPVTAVLAVSFRGYVARQRGNWPGVIRASIAARESPGAHYVQCLFDTLQAAQGHAGLADALAGVNGVGRTRHRDDSRRLLDTASSMIENMAGDNAIPPPSVYWYSPTFFRMNIGLAHLGLGNMTDATENLGAGLAGLPDEHKNTEWAAEYREALSTAKEQS